MRRRLLCSPATVDGQRDAVDVVRPGLAQRGRDLADLGGHRHALAGLLLAQQIADAGPSTDEELHALLQTVIIRFMKMLTRRGVLIPEMGQTYLAEPDADGEEARTLRPLQAAAITPHIAFGPRAGQKVLTLRGALPGVESTRNCPALPGH